MNKIQCPNCIINKNPLRLAVVGSRTCQDSILVFEYLSIISSAWEKAPDIIDMELISGGAKGPDSFAERYAQINKIPTKIFLPNWDKEGKSAGFIRNVKIVENCDMVLAFWDQKSKGTKHTIDLALKAGKPVWIIPTS